MTTLSTCWSMTINNPDENDMLIVRNPNPDYIRQLIWTAEMGEKEETPHVQCYVKLQKQQRMSFIKKLYPRGHFKSITTAVYKENCKIYAQKDDETTIGSHVITYNESIPDVVQFIRKMISESINVDPSKDYNPDTPEHWMTYNYNQLEIQRQMKLEERLAVIKNPQVAKLLVSPTYNRIKKEFFREIVENIVREGYKTNADDDKGQGTGETYDDATITTSCSSEDQEEEDDNESETDESTDSGSQQDSQQED